MQTRVAQSILDRVDLNQLNKTLSCKRIKVNEKKIFTKFQI